MDPLSLPAHLLRTAFLVGKVPFRACQKDQRVSYTLYIPEKYLEVHQALQQDNKSPAYLPLLINVHGTGRDASRCRDSLIDFAETHAVAVLAPLFPAGLDGLLDLDSYKLLRSKTLQADMVLLAILEEVQQIWPGIETGRVAMMGFSGGAQFVQRFVYVWPERVFALVVGAPGSTTLISNETWPKGTGNVDEVFDGRNINIEAMREIRAVSLFVGELDDEAAQEKYRELRTFVGGIEREFQGRIGLVKGLRENWREKGIESSLEVVEGVGHEYLGVLPAMLKCLGGCHGLKAQGVQRAR